MLRPADSVLRWCRHRGMKMYEPLFRVCVTVPGTFSLNRVDRRPLSGRDVTLRLQSRMVSVEPEPPKRDIHELSGRLRANSGVGCKRKCRFTSERSTGDPAATLTDNGRRPKLHELPGVNRDSALACCQEWAESVNGAVPRVSMHG